MAYEGGYPPQQQRPYVGPAAQRPAPRLQGPPGPGPQQYDQNQGDYGYQQDGYDNGGGYGPDYGGQYEDPSYQRGPPPNQGPPRDYYGPPRNGPPPGWGGGRPGPGPDRRPYPPPGGGGPRGPYPPRGGGYPQGPGRGYPPPNRGGRLPVPDRAGSGPRQPVNGPPMSPNEPGFGGSPFPTFPGQQRRSDMDDEAQLMNQMNGLGVNEKRPRPPINKGGQEPYRQGGGGGMRPPPGEEYGYNRAPPPRDYGGPGGPGVGGYPDQRRGPDVGYDYAPQDRDDGYGQGPPVQRDQGFGPPGRSMTMPVNEPMRGPNGGGPGAGSGPGPGPMRGGMDNAAPYNGPIGRNMPPRPATAQGNRPAPQRTYPPNGQGGYQGREYDNYNGGQEDPQQARSSFGEVYDAYFDSGRRNSEGAYSTNHAPSVKSDHMPDFDAMPSQAPRGSFDQHMNTGAGGGGPYEQQQPGPNRYAELSRTKSQPDLRQPQAAVFEMAGDVPPLPVNGPPYGQGQGGGGMGGPGGPGGIGGRGPSPPQFTMSSHADALSSHPTPVRPGLMPNSMVNQMGNKPPPVRNYDNSAPSPASTMSAQSGPLPPQSSMPPPAAPAGPEPAIPVTTEELERLRTMVKADPNDQASALLLAKKLVEASDVLVQAMPDSKTRQRSKERYVMDAHKILKKLVAAQNPEAMFFMADSIGKGAFGPEPDNKEAFTLYQSAAKLGHAAAAYRTAVCCEIGSDDGGGTRKDPLKAIQWYKRAAILGDTPAMYKVGMILLKGLLGQQRNPREAVGWLRRAAERADVENPHALHELGLLYESAAPNDAIVRDEAYAFQLFKQAAELGYKFSQFRMGCAYEYGLMGCPIDPRLSIMWYSRAATQEEHQSELSLSGWYLTGSEGVLQQSDTEAYLWARKAAIAGLAKAEYAMGYFTEVGIGVPANLEDAKRWYWRAAAQDFPKARERLEDLKRTGKTGPRQRERISRSKIGKQQEGECTVM